MQSPYQPNRTFTVQQISEKLKISKPTLRFWEKELRGILVPYRTEGGQRRYNDEHLSLLESVKVLRKNGTSLAEIREIFGNNHEHWANISGSIDLNTLSRRIAEIVRVEISRFFQNKK